ncbi:MAG: hypothetical protein DDT32_01836 [Syntrophomonadaceae bacterium]|nr:hypothetical protein [Bacillota bacterium]
MHPLLEAILEIRNCSPGTQEYFDAIHREVVFLSGRD